MRKNWGIEVKIVNREQDVRLVCIITFIFVHIFQDWTCHFSEFINLPEFFLTENLKRDLQIYAGDIWKKIDRLDLFRE